MLTIDQPRNREILLYLLTIRAVYEGNTPPASLEARFLSDEEIELVDLRTHPDLGGLLSQAAQPVQHVQHGYIYGYDVLINEHGILLAAAVGMSSLLLRLGPPNPGTILPDGQLSSEWTPLPAWGTGLTAEKLTGYVRQALTRAAALASPL